jgi:hypothetical protein
MMNCFLGRANPWGLLLSLLTLLLLTLSCGDATREITPDDLRGMVIPLEEASEVLGLPLDELDVVPDLGQEFEGIDTEKYGLVAGYFAVYRPFQIQNGYVAILMTLALFDSAEGASGSRQDILERLKQDSERFQTVHREIDPGDIDDETQGIVQKGAPGEPWVTGVALRADKVVALIWVVHSDEADMSKKASSLANRVSQRIQAFREG